MTLSRLLAALDPPRGFPLPTTRRARARAALGRRHGPVVRYWTADFTHVHTEPVWVEPFRQWLVRAPRALIYALAR